MSKSFIIEKIVVGQTFTNCYIFGCKASGECAVIDPGGDAPLIKKRLQELKLKPVCVIITHAHIDHIGAVDSFNLPVYAGCADEDYFADPRKSLSSFLGAGQVFQKPAHLLKEGDKVSVGEYDLKIIEVPGHTPGSICLFTDAILFSGDSLFAGSIGRTDFSGGNHDLLIKMIKEKLLVLNEETVVYPGHGEATTIKDEKRSNPFLG